MNDEELDPRTDPVMARLRRAMPAQLREMPPATDSAAQALMKEITMHNTTLDRNESAATAVDFGRFDDEGEVVSMRSPRRNLLMTVAAGLVIAVGAVGVSIVIQDSVSPTDRVRAAAVESRDFDSGVIVTESSTTSADAADQDFGGLVTTSTLRFDGEDLALELDVVGESVVEENDGGSTTLQVVIVDDRRYSASGDDQWLDITEASQSQPAPTFRPDEVFAALNEVEGFDEDGTEVIDGVSTTRYRATAESGELSESAVGDFVLVPEADGEPLSGPVDYTVWIDGDGVIVRLRSELILDDWSFSTDARFSDFGVPQTIEAPIGFEEYDVRQGELFEAYMNAPLVLQRCSPGVLLLSNPNGTLFAELSDPEFTEVTGCLRDNDAAALADIVEDIGKDELDEAVGSMVSFGD